MRALTPIVAALAAFSSLASAGGRALAKPPALTSLYPAGARQGTTTLVTASGTFDRWPVRSWVEGRGVRFEAATDKGKFWVNVAEDTPAGPRWVRLHDDEGASALRPFFVGGLPETVDREPNDDPKHAQRLAVDAVTVNGKLARNGDVDGFALRLSRGQTLVASMEANRRLGSPMDAILQVVNPDGFILAHNDDERDRDPQLVFEVPADGVYVVRTFAFPATPTGRIGFAGGDAFIYRLTMTTRGFLDHAYPLASTRGGSTTVRAEGWNVPPAARDLDLSFEGEQVEVATVSHPRLAGTADVLRVPHSVVSEQEPNPPGTPQDVVPPVTVSGRFERDGDVDAYRFAARKDEKLMLRVESRALGFALDPTLRLVDVSGKVLSEADDSGQRGGRDAELAFTAPTDGDYRLIVRDLNGLGGPRHVYRLTIARAEPEVRLTLSADRYTLTPGKALSLKVDLDRRNGDTGAVEIEAVGLPEGASAKAVVAEGTSRSVTLTVESSQGPRSGPFRVVGRVGKERKNVRAAEAKVEGFAATTRDVWLSILPRK
jgi:hypothetical protein